MAPSPRTPSSSSENVPPSGSVEKLPSTPNVITWRATSDSTRTPRRLSRIPRAAPPDISHTLPTPQAPTEQLTDEAPQPVVGSTRHRTATSRAGALYQQTRRRGGRSE